MQKEIINTSKLAMIDNACKELLTYDVWTTDAKIKNFVKKYILRRKTAPEDMIFWPTAYLASSLWECRDMATGVMRQKIETALTRYFERWRKKGMPIFYPDDLMAGETFLAIYEEKAAIVTSENEKFYKEALEKMAAYALSYPTDELGSLPYRSAHGNFHIYVDLIGLACPFLYEYGRFSGNNEYMELAVKQIANFLAYGMDASLNLPYHGYDVATGLKYGIIGWGRAVGWLLRGMAGCMSTEYGKERLVEFYRSLTDSVIKWQRKDGYFSWQLQALEGPVDTSATGMICCSISKGLKMGLLEGEAYEDALELGSRAIQKSVKNGFVYDCSGECEGFSQYPQRYGAYPWAMAPALTLE